VYYIHGFLKTVSLLIFSKILTNKSIKSDTFFPETLYICFHSNPYYSQSIFSASDKKVKHLEKELFFYKSQFRKHKELLRDSLSTNNTSLNLEERNDHYPNNIGRVEEGVYFPPLHNPGRFLTESEQKFPPLDAQQLEEAKRLQVCFYIIRCPEKKYLL